MDSASLILLSLPLAIYALYPAWMFNVLTHIDPWIYFGSHFYLPQYKSDWFPYTYYGDRMAWMIPGYLINKILDPLVARYVLHFGCYYLSVFSFYWLLRQTIARRQALLVSLLFGSAAQFMIAIGHDYVDAPAITYYLLACVCAVRAGQTGGAATWLFLTGVFSAAMVYSNLFMALFLLPVAVLYYYQVWAGWIWASFAAQYKPSLLLVAGFISIALALNIINFWLEGNFWLLLTSYRYSVNTFAQPTVWGKTGWGWLKEAFWLILPGVAIFAGLAQAVRRRTGPRDFPRLYLLHLALIWLFFIIWEAKNGFGLEIEYYVSCMIPAAFLVIGGCLAERNEKWNTPWYLGALGLVLAQVLCSYYAYSLGIPAFSPAWTPLLFALGLLALILADFRPGRANRAIAWASILAATFFVNLRNLSPTAALESVSHYHNVFHRMVGSVKAAMDESGKRPLQFWYDIEEKRGHEFHALNSSFHWLGTMFGSRFPEIRDGAPLEDGVKLALLSSSLSRETALKMANEALAPKGFRVAYLSSRTIEAGGAGFEMIFLSLQKLPEAKISNRLTG